MSQQTPAGWYATDEQNERYWNGSGWTDDVRPKAPTGPPAATSAVGAGNSPKPKKKRRIFLWVFLAIQLLFIVWIIGGIGSTSGSAEDCGTLSQEACDAAEDVGAGIGVFFIIVLWMIVDFFLAVIYGVYRLAKRT